MWTPGPSLEWLPYQPLPCSPRSERQHWVQRQQGLASRTPGSLSQSDLELEWQHRVNVGISFSGTKDTPSPPRAQSCYHAAKGLGLVTAPQGPGPVPFVKPTFAAGELGPRFPGHVSNFSLPTAVSEHSPAQAGAQEMPTRSPNVH